ncbi:IclR family transcriptional regulator [Bosea robiniae]|jgi:DNA-binding IclR family transcriptional regulator|uniref:DNA-binding transcriptional regulator, IclR family n=1 Tax=Bosea robiniae TaxID=1036780 RepID=A0ABY0P2P3_9HYPH|nr:IclR family transcriptional regulator [Bosea robiniae]SDG92943.1 DNA-binding transcriptional regulator, IclR family [Bosea robiniae]
MTMPEERETGRKRAAQPPDQAGRKDDALMVNSVEKAFRVLSAFGRQHPTLNLSQVASETGMDVSAAQRFTHTLTRLGYLRKDAQTKRFELTAKTLDLGYHFVRSSRLLDRAMPYLMHLSKETEETVNLTVREETEIIFVSRFLSRHVLNTDVIIGTRMPAYATAPGIAMLSRLPESEAMAIIDASDRRAHTPSTTWEREALREKLRQSAAQGYATAFEEVYLGDASIAAVVVDHHGRPEAAVNIATSTSRYSHEEVVSRFSSLVIAAAHAISRV